MLGVPSIVNYCGVGADFIHCMDSTDWQLIPEYYSKYMYLLH